ncbi:MAG: HAD family phosphatase [Plectolyngbya sp. WJT66-NPBG17]|jgi:HAD superfamily hydrolase (TIGR01509 family)|nr:HAD family phosphatase [Plectolyngbya sp. WJT66-NPBG17]MBW4523841.1 HAD family phosphatase [Phormidium tanganyikae FI6-MK23]
MTLSQPHSVVLFDHDGTVVDSEIVALKSAWKLTTEIATEFPGARLYDLPDFIKHFAGKPYREILAQLYVDAPTVLSEADIQRLVLEEEDRAIEHLSLDAKPTAGTPAVLSELCDRGIEFALVSNSSLRRLEACLTATDLTGYFKSDRVFSAHDSLPEQRPKPLPDIYLYAAKRLNAEISNCIAVEDSISGVKSAVAAGIPLIVGYVGGTHINESERNDRASVLRSAGVQSIIESMSDLTQFL